MRKAVCLNRACQTPEPIQGNLLAGLSEPQFAPLPLLPAAMEESCNSPFILLTKKAPKSSYSLGLCAVSKA